MKINTILVFSLFIFFPRKSFAQVNFGIGSGLHILNLESNIYLKDKYQIGVNFLPRIIKENTGYIGPSLKYYFIPYSENSEYSFHPYLECSIGRIHSPNLSNAFIGGYFSGGILWGAKNYSIFLETGIGRMPNTWKQVFNFSVPSISNYTSSFYLNLGLVFEFPKNNKNMYTK